MEEEEDKTGTGIGQRGDGWGRIRKLGHRRDMVGTDRKRGDRVGHRENCWRRRRGRLGQRKDNSERERGQDWNSVGGQGWDRDGMRENRRTEIGYQNRDGTG